MAFTVTEYTELRPYLYHVTARENLPRLRRTQSLQPAADLLRAAGRSDLVATRRAESVAIAVNGDTVVLKDQRPLLESNVSLAGGWTFGNFVEFLNEHVFFWPGDAIGPIISGQRLLAHYAGELPLVLRVRMDELLLANPHAEPLFSHYNTGAPRMQRGKPVPRGPDLLRPAHQARRRRFEVVEVAFRGALTLPAGVQLPAEPERWTSLIVATT